MRLLLALALAAACSAQSNLPANWAAMGASYNSVSKPPLAGWFAYAHLISESAQLYSYSAHDVFLSPTKPYTIMSSIRSGLATPLRTIGNCTGTCLMALGLGEAGMAAGGTSLAGAFSGGGVGILKFGKTHWTLAIGGQMLKVAGGVGSQTLIFAGFGRAF